ncbi:catalase [Bacillus sp. LS15-K4]|nr:catalase [Bacillus sp. LS15-K4]MDJ1477792.1 catalase [Bacillus sp. LS15-K4]
MTTNTGVTISNDENSLTAGDRGPTLLEDFLMREKLAHFDRERNESFMHVDTVRMVFPSD